MFNFTVDEGKDDSVIDIDVHFQAYATIANPDAGISVGPITNIVSATKINLYLKGSSNNIIMETSDINPNDYIGTIRLKSTVNRVVENLKKFERTGCLPPSLRNCKSQKNICSTCRPQVQ